MANKQIRREIYITANGKVAEDVLKALDTYAKKLDKDIQQLIKDGKSDSKEFKELTAVQKSLSKQMRENISDTERIAKVMADLAGSSTKQLRSALSAVRREIDRTSESSGKLGELREQFRAIQAQIDKNTGSIHKQGSAWSTAMKNLVAYVGLFGAFNTLKSKLTEIINLNLKLTDQLADIRKVSGWAIEDVNELSKRLAKIDTRNSIQQLNDLAYQGAKLGIGKYGVDGLTRFAEATAQIRMALHEDMGDEAIAQLAKMAEVMHDMERMGVSKALLASGSAIFKLGATTTATGSNIMEFSKRLLGLGRTADLTTPQILALGSAADSMALMPEVASTAFNKFITTLQSKYAQVAQAVGMNQERLKSLLDQHKTMDAIVEVLEHMRDMGDLNALAPIMGDLGSEGAKLTNVFASMASNVQMLKEHLATSTEEFEKATAVTAEFDIQNETAQALMERASNIWEKTFVNSENAAGGIKDVAKAWYDVTKAMTESTIVMGEAGLSLKALLWSIQALIGAIPALINGLVFLGAVKLASWTGWSVVFNAAAASATRFGTSLANLVGIQTAAQKSAIASAQANLAAAEAMMVEAHQGIALAQIKQTEAMTDEEVIAAESALAAATTNAAAAQQMLATAMGEVAAITGVEVNELALDANAKIYDALHTNNLWAAEEFLATSEATVTAATTAQTAAIERDAVAKEANITTSKNLKLAWGALIFIGLVAVVEKLVDEFKKLNKEEERNKEVTDKVASALANANSEYNTATQKLKALFEQLERNWKIEDERKRLIGEINSQYGEYIGNIIDEKTQVGELAGKYEDATDALREYYYYKQKSELKDELVNDPKKNATKSLMHFQQKVGDIDWGEDEEWVKASMSRGQDFLFDAIEQMYNEDKDSRQAAQELWKMMTKSDVPSNAYTDLSKLPLVGGMFPKDTFRSDEQEAMSYFYDATRKYYEALNNDAYIDFNFPGEWTPPKRSNKDSQNNSNNATAPEDDARANISEFITKIKNFYERQITATMEELTAQGVEKELQDQAVDALQKRMKLLLSYAQESIVLGTDAWKQYNSMLDEDLKEREDEYGQSQSLALKDALQQTDALALRADILKQMPKIKKGKVVGMKSDESDFAYLDRMWLNESKNQRGAATIDQQYMEKRRKELLEHDYTGVVKQNSFLGLISSGFANVNLDTLVADKKKVIAVLEKGRKDLVGLYQTGGEKDKLLKFLFGEDYETAMPNEFASVLEMGEDEVRLFYHKLIQYSDEYTQAEKKNYDEQKKKTDFLWKSHQRNLANQKAMRDMQNEANLFGKRTNFASNLGLADLTADPEVELMKLKMQMAEDYYAFVKKNSQNQQLIDEADKARQEAQLAYVNQMATAMKERLSQMKDLVGPIETFGAQIGEALGKMTDDAESASEAIKGALKSMVKSWGDMLLNDVKTQLWKGINDAGAKRAAKNAQPDIAAAQQNADAEIGVVSEELGASAARPMYVWLVNGQTVDAKGNPVSTEGKENVQTLSGAPGDMSGAKSSASGIAADAGSALGEGVADVATGGSLKDAAAGIVGKAGASLLGASFGGGDPSSKQRKAELKAARKHEKEMQKVKKDSMKAQSKETEKGMSDMVDTTQEGNDEQTGITRVAEDVKGKVIDTALTANLGKQKEANQEAVQNDADSTRARVTLSIAGAIGKCFEFLGPIAGPIMAGVVMATLQGLLQWALSAAFGGSGSKSESTPKTNTKLVSGMLTYDQGNVQDLKPFFDKDGNMYWAEDDSDQKHQGVNLLTTPTATTINGERSLVAEQGPELVIGRETTQAMMQNNPALLKALYQYDKHHSGRTAYDRGNLSQIPMETTPSPSTGEGQGRGSATDVALLAAVNALLARLNEPINAKIDMYGRGNLYDSMTKAGAFMKGK